ncbi:MAG: 2OG-Fe(II) oxygenase family protein [Hormoscilla sp.]
MRINRGVDKWLSSCYSQIIKEFSTVNKEQPSIKTGTDVMQTQRPGELENLAKYPSFKMERARMEGDRLLFDHPDGMMRALGTGVFSLEIPSEFHIAAGDLIARHYFEEPLGDDLDAYRGFRNITRDIEYFGYKDYEDVQWEQFSIERAEWDALYPDNVARLGEQMLDLGIGVVHNVLEYLGIKKSDWENVTSGLSEKRGNHMLSFNHYRSEKNCRGFSFHKDTTWVSVVRSTEPGLVGVIGEKIFSLNPVPGHFTINFGSTIEFLTEQMVTPVHALRHGVVRTQRSADREDRTSYVLFLDSNLGGLIYRYENGEAKPIQPVKEFLFDEDRIFSKKLAKYNCYLD